MFVAPVEHLLTEPAARLGARLASTYGLRILVAWGFGRVVRIVALFVWLAVLVITIGIQRPDLLHPATFGSDTSNYVAFGERLASGGELYSLSAGDRPVPADNPPHWSTPILSPPQMAIPWAALTVAPDLVRFYGPWGLGVAGTLTLGFLFVARAPSLIVIGGSVMFAGLAVTAWSGNVNALIAPTVLAVWWVGSRQVGRRWLVAVGAIVGLLGAVKFGPVMLWLWLVRRRGWAPAIGGAVAVGIATGIVFAVAGRAPFDDYIAISLASADDPTPQSIPGLLTGIGLSADAARIAWLALLGTMAGLIVVGRWSRAGFVAAIVASVFLTPVVRPETMSLLLGAAAPWMLPTGDQPIRAVAIKAGSAGLVIAAIGIAVSIGSGGLSRSSVTIENASSKSVTVRFTVPMQQASWGHDLAAGQAGWAWLAQPGAVLDPIRIFDERCELIGSVNLDERAFIRIDDEGIDVGVAEQAARPLAYAMTCATAMPRPGSLVD